MTPEQQMAEMQLEIGRLERALEAAEVLAKTYEESVRKLQQEEVRRIKHLNRLGSWAQQDPTGPIQSPDIQKWVLAELKAALGSAYEPTAWQPQIVSDLTAGRDWLKRELDRTLKLLRILSEFPMDPTNAIVTRNELARLEKLTEE